MNGLRPTDEQAACIDAFRAGGNLSIAAGAGTGKTSTLRMLAAEAAPRRGTYLAFNRSVADDAKASFPRNVRAVTTHGYAYRSAVTPVMQARLNQPRQGSWVVAKTLRLKGGVRINQDVVLAPKQIARLAMGAIIRFCESDDPELRRRHVPTQLRCTDPASRQTLVQEVLPVARRAWDDILNPGGQLAFNHAYYLKLFQLAGTVVPTDFLCLDEAQDSNAVTRAICRTQEAAGAQVVVVGDSQQAIYSWRGASDGMDVFGGTKLYLTPSWRFGPAIADEANKWLTLLESPMRLTGNPALPSTVGPLGGTWPDTVLCRTNSEAVAVVMACLAGGRSVALVGGGRPIRDMAEAAEQLRASGFTDHPELCAFTSWDQVCEYVDEDPAGSDLRVFVKLIDSYGSAAVIRAMDSLATERDASLVVSTAHKAKGREWPVVRVADDFGAPRPSSNQDEHAAALESLRLSYVTVTRAKQHLDRGSLSWIDDALPAGALPPGAASPGYPMPPTPTPPPAPPPPPPPPAGPCGEQHSRYLAVTCALPTGHDGDHFTDDPSLHRLHIPGKSPHRVTTPAHAARPVERETA